MPKKFKQIMELVRKDTLVPGSDASVSNQKLRKVPGHERNASRYNIPSKGVPDHTKPSGLLDRPKKKMYEDGAVAMSAGTGGFSNAADPKGPVAGFDVPLGNKILRRKKPK